MFPEGPRWRDGRWWLSDQLGHRVLTLDESGAWSVVAEVPRPSGLGFLPDGILWVATMDEARIVAVGGDGVREAVSLRHLAAHLNDMVVDSRGGRTSTRTGTGRPRSRACSWSSPESRPGPWPAGWPSRTA